MKNRRPPQDGQGTAPSSELPYLPTLMLCLVYQMLLNFRRVEPSIRRPAEGDYAIVIPHLSCDWCYLLAIVPTETGLTIDAIEVDSPDDEFSVTGSPEKGLDLAGMLDLVMHAAADMGNRPAETFVETMEALSRLNDPRLSRIRNYLTGLCLGDIRNELAEAIRS